MTNARASTPQPSKYLEFLTALYQAKDARGDLMLLESTDQRFLEFIAVQWALNKPLSMMQILRSREVLFLGASTISRKVEALREAGWIRAVADSSDRRIKWLEPTDQALAYLERVNTLMPD
jgi:DNA-binding MarR family transcriptional regulator